MSGREGPRQYRVDVRGFDFSFVIVAARSRGRARSIVARAFSDAGWGSYMNGLRTIVSCRLHRGEPRPLVTPTMGPEGLCAKMFGAVYFGT